MLGADELQRLADDIGSHGLHEPIMLFQGQILDGRNRWKACKLADVTPTFQEFNGSEEQALQYVWGVNVTRRHLSPMDKFFALNGAQAYREAAAKRYRENVGRPKKSSAELHEVSDGQTDESRTWAHDAAQLIGRSPRTVYKLQRVAKDGAPALVEAVRREWLSPDAAEKLIQHLSVEEQQVLIEGAEPRDVKSAVQTRLREIEESKKKKRKPEIRVGNPFAGMSGDDLYADAVKRNWSYLSPERRIEVMAWLEANPDGDPEIAERRGLLRANGWHGGTRPEDANPAQ
jgi:ParB-like nuclease family protein